MTTGRLNTGNYLVRPYQSDYAMVRQFFTVNRGLSLSVITSTLRKEGHAGGPIEAIRSYKGDKTSSDMIAEQQVHGRHKECLACRKEMFHSNIFNLPWLKLCPIHSAPLTDICPTCKEKWPSIKEMHSRKCSGCGVVGTAQIKISSNNFNEKEISNIRFIINVCKQHLSQDIHIFGSSGYQMREELSYPQTCFSSININSTLFPSVVCHAYSPELGAELTKFSCDIKKLSIRKTNLTRLKKKESNSSFSKMALKTDQSVYSDWMMRSEYRIFKAIVDCLHYASPCHKPVISSYRYIKTKHLSMGPPPCIFCLALSTWFFHIYGRRLRGKDINPMSHYHFVNEQHFEFFPKPLIPIIGFEGAKYLPDKKFSRWLYERVLKIIFVDIFSKLNRLLEVNEYRDEWNLIAHQGIAPAFSTPFFAQIASSELSFLYTDECFFEDLPMNHSDNRCNRFHRWLSTIIEKDQQFSYDLIPSRFSYNDYKTLIEDTKLFISNRMGNYCRGSEPIHIRARYRNGT